jgi:hypothetical protein
MTKSTVMETTVVANRQGAKELEAMFRRLIEDARLGIHDHINIPLEHKKGAL